MPPATSGDAPKDSAAQLTRQLASGSAWMLAMRWSIKAIGLVSTLVLARLLTPDDFGLVAKAMVLVALLEALTDTGQRVALIRMEAPSREHYDTAWTIQIILGAIAGAVIFFGAPFAARYFGDADVVLVAQMVALRPVIAGFENIGTVDFRRNLDFRREFRFGVITKVSGFVATMALAFTLRNYWALIGGMVATSLAIVATSYWMHPFRPRPSLAKTRDLWSFSTWMLLNSFIYYVQEKVDQIIIAGAANPTVMGFYFIGAELGRLPTSEIVGPMVRAFYPVYARAARDAEKLKTIYLRVLSIVAMAMIPASVGLALVAADLIAVMLGQQWLEAAPYMTFIALAAGVSTVSGTVLPVLMAIGQPRRLTVQSMFRLGLMTPMLLVGQHLDGVQGVTKAMLVAELVLAPTFFHHLMRPLGLSLADLAGPCWRPLLAAAAMAGAVLYLPAVIELQQPVLRLIVHVGFGAAVFCSVCGVLWVIAGRPEGAESVAYGAVRQRTSPFQL
ncbi:lipopolysaccharide biosynthesis protein [Desertibaculum subflavum]|uniref:lipopolysaccharide biosynthesis protein n=1 Tax=Desertibaculum subflavum TaxID=2268458 RepID=UPI000E675B10